MTRARVAEVVATGGLNFAVLQLEVGEIAMGMVLSDNNGSWRIIGMSTVPAVEWSSGRRGVNLQPVECDILPAVGSILVVMQAKSAEAKLS